MNKYILGAKAASGVERAIFDFQLNFLPSSQQVANSQDFSQSLSFVGQSNTITLPSYLPPYIFLGPHISSSQAISRLAPELFSPYVLNGLYVLLCVSSNYTSSLGKTVVKE